MKLKTSTSFLVLYVCCWPGLEDYSSGPGIVSRSLSRGEWVKMRVKMKLKTSTMGPYVWLYVVSQEEKMCKIDEIDAQISGQKECADDR